MLGFKQGRARSAEQKYIQFGAGRALRCRAASRELLSWLPQLSQGAPRFGASLALRCRAAGRKSLSWRPLAESPAAALFALLRRSAAPFAAAA